MKILSFIALSLTLIASSEAVELKVVGKNAETLFQQELSPTLPSHVGQISFDAFQANGVPFVGGNYGFSSLFEFGQTIEAISDTEMKAYGWCFGINGEVPETMADETPVLHSTDAIEWYYAYAHLKDGVWIKQCARP